MKSHIAHDYWVEMPLPLFVALYRKKVPDVLSVLPADLDLANPNYLVRFSLEHQPKDRFVFEIGYPSDNLVIGS